MRWSVWYSLERLRRAYIWDKSFIQKTNNAESCIQFSTEKLTTVELIKPCMFKQWTSLAINCLPPAAALEKDGDALHWFSAYEALLYLIWYTFVIPN